MKVNYRHNIDTIYTHKNDKENVSLSRYLSGDTKGDVSPYLSRKMYVINGGVKQLPNRFHLLSRTIYENCSLTMKAITSSLRTSSKRSKPTHKKPHLTVLENKVH